MYVTGSVTVGGAEYLARWHLLRHSWIPFTAVARDISDDSRSALSQCVNTALDEAGVGAIMANEGVPGRLAGEKREGANAAICRRV